MSERKSIDRFIFFVVIILIIIIAARVPLDSDFWWHVRAGESTWLEHKPVLVDNYSYTVQGSNWINHSWLSQIIFYLLFQIGDYYAITLLVCLLAAGAMCFVYFQLDGPAIFKSFLLVGGSIVASMVWSPRPQMFSLLLLAIISYILYLYKWKEVDKVWIIPFLFIVWSNLHGGFPLGIILILCVMGGEIFNHITGMPGENSLSWNKILNLGTVLLVSVVFLLINPNGINTWVIPFKTVGLKSLQQFISEWASPDFHDISQQPFLLLVLVFTASVGLSKVKLVGSDLITFVVFTWMGFYARRNYGPFAIVILPALSRYLWSAMENIFFKIQRINHSNKPITLSEDSNPRATKKYNLVINNMLIIALIAAAALKIYSVSSENIVKGYAAVQFPVNAVKWINNNLPDANIFNEYEWGGYLISQQRNYLVFIDGRTDLYGDELINEWMSVIEGRDGWQKVLDRWNIKTILIKPNRPVAAQLTQFGWSEAYRDNQAVVFTR